MLFTKTPFLLGNALYTQNLHLRVYIQLCPTQGTGKDEPSVSDWITSLKIVKSDGEVYTYSEHDLPGKRPSDLAPEDAMNALRVNMGVFGALVELTLRVEPAKTVQVDQTFPTIGELFYAPKPGIMELLKNNDTVQLLWLPFNSLGIVGSLLEIVPLVSMWNPQADEVWVRAINIEKDKYAVANK